MIDRFEWWLVGIAYNPSHDSALWFWPVFLAEIGLLIIRAGFRHYMPVSWAEEGRTDTVRLPFFIYWPLYWWRELQIGFLTWKVQNRDRVA